MITTTKPLPGAQINPLHPLASGLIGYWPFNEKTGSRVQDLSHKNNHGTLINSEWCSSKYGGSIYLDGSNDYINCGNDKSLDVTTGFSFSTWIKPTNVISWGTVLSKMGADDAHSSIYVYISNNLLGIRLYASGGAWNYTYGPITANIWQHVVSTYDGDSIKLYINNVLVGTTSGVSTINTNVNDVLIGGNERWLSEKYSGIIDNVSIYNQGISKFNVTQLFYKPYSLLL